MDYRADLLYPLRECYDRTGAVPPAISRLDGEEMPPALPAAAGSRPRHGRPTLEAAFGQPIHLRVMQQWRSGELLTRQVLLVLDQEGIPAVFGAIRIHLDAFPLPAREEILQGHRPLGCHSPPPPAGAPEPPPGIFSGRSRWADQPGPAGLVPGTLSTAAHLLRSLQKGTLAEILEILPALQEVGGQGLRIQSN